ncbi:MAG TPA: amidohydrolase family protein [Falsiroseomonas sp.]|jgi:predicted TIM-barrel fold metal-dependent hydrolase|nr:amidohydrolase family protein [Falsiroseomonas sp.]
MNPRLTPPGATDCHCHIFGPAARFPYAEPRSYTPEDETLEGYLVLLDDLGLDRGVVVQPSAYDRDNACTLDALRRAPDRLRGVGVVGAEATPEMLRAMHRDGVRGLRANEYRRGGAAAYQGGVRLAEIEPLMPVMAELGWHLQLWIDAQHLPDIAPRLARVPVPIVVDHMGRMHHSDGVSDPSFNALRCGVAEGQCVVKLSGTYRLGATEPDYLEAKPFHDALLAANPDALVWGTDWPHPRPEGGCPDAACLLQVFLDWTPDQTLRSKILSETPSRLYDFPPP